MKAILYSILFVFTLFFANELHSQEITAAKDTSLTEVPDTTQQSSSGFEMPVDYNAQDSINFEMGKQGTKIYLYKEATVKYGDVELKADYIEFNVDSMQIYAKGVADSTGTMIGEPEFKDGGDNYRMKEMWYNFKTKKALIKGVITEQNDGYLHSQVTKMQTCGDVHIAGGKYTTCDHDHPHFYIALSKAIVKKEKKIISGPLYFVIEDVPLPIGLPFGFFPSTKGRGSGFIMPTYGEENRRGFFIRGGGYYFAFSDHWDLAVTGEVYSKGTFGINAKSRYVKRYRYDGDFDLRYQSLIDSEKGLPDYSKKNSYSIRWTHKQSPKANPYSNFSANVNFETNSYSEKNSTTHYERQNTQKSSSVSFRKSFPNAPFNFTANLNASQNTQRKSVNVSLPVMNLNMNKIYPLKRKTQSGGQKWWEQLSVGYSSNFTNTLSTADSLLFEAESLEKFQTGYKHSVPVSIPIKIPKINFLTFTPSFSYEGVVNTKYIEKTWHAFLEQEDTTITNTIVVDTIQGIKYAHQYNASFSIAVNPTWYGMYQFKPEWLKSRVEAIRHVITPSVSFSIKPASLIDDGQYIKTVQVDEKGKEEEYDIFSGVGAYRAPTASRRSGNFSFGLRNSLEMKVRSRKDTTAEFKKIKILENLSFSSSYNIFADSLNLSPVTFTGSTNILQKIRIQFSGSFDPYAYNPETGSKINKYFYDANQKLRMTNANLSLGMQFKSETDTKGRKVEKGHMGNGYYDEISREYIDFSIPWSFSVDYSLRYSQQFDRVRKKFKEKYTQNVRVRSNFSLTKKWKIKCSSAYDFDAKKFTSTNFGLTRDLHCWTMTFDWIPFGRMQSYNFRIAINSSVFDGVEYKIDKRNYNY